jgi:hypothetical protein
MVWYDINLRSARTYALLAGLDTKIFDSRDSRKFLNPSPIRSICYRLSADRSVVILTDTKPVARYYPKRDA